MTFTVVIVTCAVPEFQSPGIIFIGPKEQNAEPNPEHNTEQNAEQNIEQNVEHNTEHTKEQNNEETLPTIDEFLQDFHDLGRVLI